MLGRVEKLGTPIILIVATLLGATSVHREFFGPSRPTAPMALAPEHMKNWQEALAVGTFVGDTSAPVKVIEFADLECPFCKTFHTRFQTLKGRYGKNVALVFVHFPLPMHRFARPAGRALECAREQGRFDHFQDIVYAKQDSLGLKSWLSYATEAGIVDSGRFSHCIAETTKVANVESGLSLGSKLGIRGTPTVIVNGWRFRGVPSDSALSAIVDGVLAGRESGRPDSPQKRHN
jgi:protein-disulfide isomerase